VIEVAEKGSAVQARPSRCWASMSLVTRHGSRVTGDVSRDASKVAQLFATRYSLFADPRRKDALNRQESYQYDPAGNLSQFTDRKNQQSTFSYDSLNRRIGASYADGSSTNFVYDSVGRLAKATDSIAGTVEFGYDNLNRLAQETTSQGTVTYQYDFIGRRSQMTANGQQPVTYGYDAASRLTQVAQGALVVGIGYDNANRRMSLTYPNGTNTAYSYDNASRLTAITHNGPSGLIESLTYAYDAAGNRISLTRTNGTASNLPVAVQAAYDAANQQIQFNSANPNQTFDANGNLTSDGTNTYTWDARNRLTSISGGTTANFTYDALGRRVSKTINNVTTHFLYDGNDIVQEIGGSAVGASYVRSLNIDEPFVRQMSSGNEFYHTDALGSSLALSNAAGATAVSYSYEAFGKTTMTGTSSNPFQYTGRENDGAGLYYYRARYYSPALHRFFNEDPLELFGGDINLYAYAKNTSVNSTDPSGLCPVCLVPPLIGLSGPAIAVAVDAAILTTEAIVAAALLNQIYESRRRGDDTGFRSPEDRKKAIEDADRIIQDPNASAREKSKARRRKHEIEAEDSKRAHGADKKQKPPQSPDNQQGSGDKGSGGGAGGQGSGQGVGGGIGGNGFLPPAFPPDTGCRKC